MRLSVFQPLGKRVSGLSLSRSMYLLIMEYDQIVNILFVTRSFLQFCKGNFKSVIYYMRITYSKSCEQYMPRGHVLESGLCWVLCSMYMPTFLYLR